MKSSLANALKKETEPGFFNTDKAVVDPADDETNPLWGSAYSAESRSRKKGKTAAIKHIIKPQKGKILNTKPLYFVGFLAVFLSICMYLLLSKEPSKPNPVVKTPSKPIVSYKPYQPKY